MSSCIRSSQSELAKKEPGLQSALDPPPPVLNTRIALGQSAGYPRGNKWGTRGPGAQVGERVIGGAGLTDIELANPLDTFAGARGEASVREFGTLGYSIRARRPE